MLKKLQNKGQVRDRPLMPVSSGSRVDFLRTGVTMAAFFDARKVPLYIEVLNLRVTAPSRTALSAKSEPGRAHRSCQELHALVSRHCQHWSSVSSMSSSGTYIMVVHCDLVGRRRYYY